MPGWFIPDVIVKPCFLLNCNIDEKHISALQGLSQIGFWTRPHPTFESELSSLQSDHDYQLFYMEAHREEGGVSQSEVNITKLFSIISFYAYYTYDAVMALGIAAYNTQDDDVLFSGSALNQELGRITFNGVTGPVAFEPSTRTRRWETVIRYGLGNFFVDDSRFDDETAFIQARTALVFERNTDKLFRKLHPLIFADGTTTPPASLMELEQDWNFISASVYLFGWIRAGAMILTCLMLIAWVYKHRKEQRVAAAQAQFLILILVGTILMAASMIPHAFQEPTGLDVACMSIPWLYFTGFSSRLERFSLKRDVFPALI
jgi:hypothetical protein